jgi:hypothetical protein
MDWMLRILMLLSVVLGIAVWILGYRELKRWAPPVPVIIGIAIFLIVVQIAETGAVAHGEWITIPAGILIDIVLGIWLYRWWQDRKNISR